jgi:hypothetical protein
MSRTRRYAIGGAALVAALVTAAIAIAQVIPSGSGGTITAVKAVQGPTESDTSSEMFVPVPRAVTAPFTVGPGGALMLVRFSAESECGAPPGTAPGTACFIRIMLVPPVGQGVALEAFPDEGDSFAFDQVGIGSTDDRNEAHAIDRWLEVGPGKWSARVEYAVGNAAATFFLDDWSLIVERADKGP